MTGDEVLEQNNGLLIMALRRHGERQIIDTFRVFGFPRQKVKKQLFRHRVHAHPYGQPPQVDQDIRVVGEELQRRLIAAQRSAEVPAGLLCDSQNMPADPAAFINFQRFQRQGRSFLWFMRLDVHDGALKERDHTTVSLFSEPFAQQLEGVRRGA
nr:hypothetical protein [Phenylobacterium sp.]